MCGLPPLGLQLPIQNVAPWLRSVASGSHNGPDFCGSSTQKTHTHWFCLKGKKFGWEVREVLKGHHIDQNEEDEWNGRPMNGEEVGEAAFLVNAFGSSSCGRWSATRAMSLFEGNRKAGNEIDKAGKNKAKAVMIQTRL